MLRSLFKDTAIYGLSSIIGRFLNYLLVPLYTHQIAAASGGYGVITEVYSYVAVLFVLLTFGMETTFFRFANKEGADVKRVYSTVLLTVGGVGSLFVLLVTIFLDSIAGFIGYATHPEYIWMMATCVAIDAFQSIPFGYLFGINLGCTALITLFFYKELTGFRYVLDRQMLRPMLRYGMPILVLGIAGILNQTADKMIFPHLVEGAAGREQLGIYGACVKIAMIMAMITQAFRYAYEPIVFAKGGAQDMGKAMKFFLIFTLLAFLMVVGYTDILKFIIAPDYWDGLRVVPIVMVAEIMMGVAFNLSFWYKLIDKTMWGLWISLAGCVTLVAINVIFIPTYGYMACAWAGVAGYGVPMLLSYFLGQKYNPTNYPLKEIGVYVGMTALFFVGMHYSADFIEDLWLRLLVNTGLIGAYGAHVVYHEFLKKRKVKIS